MGMSPDQVIELWSATPCRIETKYHDRPAEAWGYYSSVDGPPKPADCSRANFWIYFEDGRLIGWTPPT